MSNSVRSRAIRIGAAAAASGLAVVMLAGCGSESNSDSESSAPAPTQSSTSESPMVGGDPGTWAPVEVTAEMNGKTLEMVPNQAANFVGFPASDKGYYVTSSDDSVVKGSNSLDATTVPGFQALAAGSATVTLWDGDPNATDPTKKGQPVAEVMVMVEAEMDKPEMGGPESEDDTTTE